MMIGDGEYGGCWTDLHGQSGESIGIGTSRAYFDFARDRAFLDATSHQANDFQVNNAFWAFLNELTAHHQQDGRFVTFPGYAWSGNTAVGGDRNVFFRTEGRPIRRSSHALLPERHDLDTDAPNAKLLFEAMADEDCVIFAHVGGRYAGIGYVHDPKLETVMEIHSAWGTFEWLLTAGFRLGHRSGVVCNSDGHKGRPGASYPGASTFGAFGGLICYLAEELTRDGIFDSLRQRHHRHPHAARCLRLVRHTGAAVRPGPQRLRRCDLQSRHGGHDGRHRRDQRRQPDAARRGRHPYTRSNGWESATASRRCIQRADTTPLTSVNGFV